MRKSSWLTNAFFGWYSWAMSWLIWGAAGVLRGAKGRARDGGPIRPASVTSVVVVRLDLMGDFVVFSSILRGLREGFPGARIALVLDRAVCGLAAGCPYVDEIIPVSLPGPKWRQFFFGPGRAWRVAKEKLRGRFDLAINARYDRDIPGGGMMACLSLAPQVVGFAAETEPAKARIFNRGSDKFYTHLLPVVPGPCHEMNRNREILRYLGIGDTDARPELWLSAEDRQAAGRLLRERGWTAGERMVCLGIHAGAARRMWPLERYQELAGRIGAVMNCRYLLVGGPADRGLGELLRPALGDALINLAGHAAVRVSAAALAECCVYVGSDSGPMHIAAALGKPVVEISCHPLDGDAAHFQSPVRWRALTEPFELVCPKTALAPCTGTCGEEEAHCIRQVGVQEVFEAVMSVLPAVPASL